MLVQMADGEDGVTVEEANDEGVGPGSDLLMGFLSDFRSGEAQKKRADREISSANAARRTPHAGSEPAATSESPVAYQETATASAGSTGPEQPPAPVPWYGAPAAQVPINVPGRRRGGRLTITALAALVVLAAAGVAVANRGTSAPSYPAAWDPRVAPIAQFVQSQRGLRWKHPVKVDFLATDKFNALMAKENAPDPRTTQDEQAMFDAMRAIGVASGNVDLAKSAQQFAQNDVVGQYVDSDHTVYVSGDNLTPYVRSTLAHELTHALQAQYFSLEKMRAGHADDDSAVTALIEGDAVRIQNAYEQSLSAADQELLAQEQQATSGHVTGQNTADGIPTFMVDQAQFPYDFGPTFVAALVADGGNRRVDAAFKNPPTLDSDIVDPETYVPGAAAPTVAAPILPKGAHVVMPASGFGEVTLLEMLGDQIGFSSAWAAVQGWTQDRSVVYRQGGQVCISLSVLNDGPTSAGALSDAGRAWASHLPAASVSQSGMTVDFRACDPGSAWKAAVRVDDPYGALAVRSVLTYQLITDGRLDSTKATCASDQLMSTIGPQKLQGAEQSSDPNSPALQQLTAALPDAVAECG